eukprot:1079008-Rhodomonas_salina.1
MVRMEEALECAGLHARFATPRWQSCYVLVSCEQALSEADETCRATRMLLQVHDELLFEVPEGEEEEAAAVIKDVMEQLQKCDAEMRCMWVRSGMSSRAPAVSASHSRGRDRRLVGRCALAPAHCTDSRELNQPSFLRRAFSTSLCLHFLHSECHEDQYLTA